MAERKPAYYWKSWENFKKEMGKVIQKLGHFPSYQELQNSKPSTIAYAATSYHNGMNAIRTKMRLGKKK